eukprot:CAMPEP_0183379224 /NCGR_PEP_ID=MMETSP0164_2-20130417/125321_1 /TAXON_ID=221442 /ORGANISM="Coccolithus pelagicus ssp braarudi, Strain PLY182g" /LENGTH=122 /DNA_ID=CAMNT_0025556805 /DNA_START=305 /DNA_END=674 /DNA_ORIENTATION=+
MTLMHGLAVEQPAALRRPSGAAHVRTAANVDEAGLLGPARVVLGWTAFGKPHRPSASEALHHPRLCVRLQLHEVRREVAAALAALAAALAALAALAAALAARCPTTSPISTATSAIAWPIIR